MREKINTCLSFLNVLFLLFLSGCSLEPAYHRPSAAAPEQWKTRQEPMLTQEEVAGWWEIFHDPELNRLMAEAIGNNPGLMAATERVEQARDLAKIARSRLFPHLNLAPGYRDISFLNKYPFGPSSKHPYITKNSLWEYQYTLPLTVNYEVDLWGAIRNTYKAAKLSAIAEKEALQAVLLVLTADLAHTYYRLCVQDAQIDLLQSIIDTRKKALEIYQSRYEGRIINYTEVASAEQDLDFAESQLFAAWQLRNVLENQLAVLLGTSASEFSFAHHPLSLSAQPPLVPAGLPTQMLLRRPDLAEQERIMASLHAKIGVAYASYFPSLFLTGSLGFRSPDWDQFLTGKSKYWRTEADIFQFIFDAGARHYNVKYTWAQFRESLEIYRQKVLTAFQEVEDALSNLEWIVKGMGSLQDAVFAAKSNATIASDRYQFGVINYLDVANKNRQEFENQRAYLLLLGMQYGNTIQLIKALGGGWDDEGRKLDVAK